MKKTVQLENKTVEIGTLPIGKYADVLKGLQELPKHLNELAGKKKEDIFPLLPGIIAGAVPDVIQIITIATGLPSDEVAQMGLNEIIDILSAIYETNQFKEAWDKVKKIFPPLANLKNPDSQTGLSAPLTPSLPNTGGESGQS